MWEDFASNKISLKACYGDWASRMGFKFWTVPPRVAFRKCQIQEMHKHSKCSYKTFIFFICSKVNIGNVCVCALMHAHSCLNMHAYVMVCHVEATGKSQLYTVFHVGPLWWVSSVLLWPMSLWVLTCFCIPFPRGHGFLIFTLMPMNLVFLCVFWAYQWAMTLTKILFWVKFYLDRMKSTDSLSHVVYHWGAAVGLGMTWECALVFPVLSCSLF